MLLYSTKSNRYYTGSAEDVQVRLMRHNAGYVTAARNGLPWELKFTESFNKRHEALKRELEIKRKKSRKYIEWLLSNNKL